MGQQENAIFKETYMFVRHSDKNVSQYLYCLYFLLLHLLLVSVCFLVFEMKLQMSHQERDQQLTAN